MKYCINVIGELERAPFTHPALLHSPTSLRLRRKEVKNHVISNPAAMASAGRG